MLVDWTQAHHGVLGGWVPVLPQRLEKVQMKVVDAAVQMPERLWVKLLLEESRLGAWRGFGPRRANAKAQSIFEQAAR